MVRILIGMHMDKECIARDILQIDKATMLKHFKDEIQRGVSMAQANLKMRMWLHAQNGSVRAIAYLLDRSGAWPLLETGTTQQPQQMIIRVHGGAASVVAEEMISKPTNGAAE